MHHNLMKNIVRIKFLNEQFGFKKFNLFPNINFFGSV